MFNTFPTKQGGSSGDSGAASSSLFSPPAPLIRNAGVAKRNIGTSVYAEGFDGDGDTVQVPDSVSGTIRYYNNAGTQVWSISRTTLQAAADAWVGFWMNDDGSLLYALTVDHGTSPHTYLLSTINKAGTVAPVGAADQPSVGSSEAAPSYHTNTQLGLIDNSTLAIWINDAAAADLVYATMDITTGQFLTGFVALTAATPSGGSITPEGIIYTVEQGGGNPFSILVLTKDGWRGHAQVTPSSGWFWTSAGQGKLANWKGYIGCIDGGQSNVNRYGPYALPKAQLDAKILQIAKIAGYPF